MTVDLLAQVVENFLVDFVFVQRLADPNVYVFEKTPFVFPELVRRKHFEQEIDFLVKVDHQRNLGQVYHRRIVSIQNLNIVIFALRLFDH